MVNRFLIVVMTLTIFGCSSSDEDPCVFTRLSIAPQGINIDLRNGNDESMIGSEFPQDSFKLYNPNHAIYLYPYSQGDNTSLFIWFDSINSGEDYFLELNQQDNDTLNIAYTLREGECFNTRTLDKFFYNNQILYNGEEIESGYYTILKD